MALTHIILNMDVSSFANSVNQYHLALRKSVDSGGYTVFHSDCEN